MSWIEITILVITHILVGALGCAVCALTLVKAVNDRADDTELFDLLESNQWHLSNNGGVWAVLKPDAAGKLRVIGTGGPTIRDAIVAALSAPGEGI